MNEPEIVKILDAGGRLLGQEQAIQNVDVLRNQTYLRRKVILVNPHDLLLICVDQFQAAEPCIQEFEDLPRDRGLTRDNLLPVSVVFVLDLLDLLAFLVSLNFNEMIEARELYSAQLDIRVQVLLCVRVVVEICLLVVQITQQPLYLRIVLLSTQVDGQFHLLVIIVHVGHSFELPVFPLLGFLTHDQGGQLPRRHASREDIDLPGLVTVDSLVES